MTINLIRLSLVLTGSAMCTALTWAQEGACCTFEGFNIACENTTEDMCDGGFRPDVLCSTSPFVPNPCTETGACCQGGGTLCQGLTVADCLQEPGNVWTPEDCPSITQCPTDEPLGACCLISGTTFTCIIDTEDGCLSRPAVQAASYSGDGTTCTPGGLFDSCPVDIVLGGCCLGETNVCFNSTAMECDSQGGQYLGDDEFCFGSCPSGACCGDFDLPALSVSTTEFDCDALGGTWISQNSEFRDQVFFVRSPGYGLAALCAATADSNQNLEVTGPELIAAVASIESGSLQYDLLLPLTETDAPDSFDLAVLFDVVQFSPFDPYLQP